MTTHQASARHKCLATLLAALLACGLLAALTSGRARAARPAHHGAHAASHYLVGIGDEFSQMFSSQLWQQLHTKIARYIAPYDAVTHRDSLARVTAWIQAAEEQHEQILVAFYHSEHTPTRMPSVSEYAHDVQKFVKRFPRVRQYQAWDEANRGNITHYLSSPSASATARYYQALHRACTTCTVIGLDVLDQSNIGPTLTYIAEFKREIGHLRTVMPSIWGLHDYSDVNRLESWRTREVSRALGGVVWLTETGGIVQFGGAFPNRNGSGLSRAAKVLNYTFNLAGSQGQIRRLYIYNWTGGVNSSRFDAGLTDSRDRPRMGYQVVCHRLHGAKCNVRLSKH
ncbi:MAG TPA: hypothetical protein VNZ05_08045 [Solirubrobacteraceae bacterium]|nr:hypothetical protein [Solirubrobacteraceae bacterium]